MLSAGRRDSIGAVPGQVIDARCSTTGADGPDSTADGGVAAGVPTVLSAGRRDSIGAVPGQVIDARCSTTGADGPDSTADGGVAAGVPTVLSAGRRDSIGAVPGQVIDARCSTTGADGPDSTADGGVAAGAAPAELCDVIVASRATDHGGNRESAQLLRVGADRGVSCHRSWKKSLKCSTAMRSRSWRLVPQIMEEIVDVIHCDEEQIVASRATDHGRNRGSIQLVR